MSGNIKITLYKFTFKIKFRLALNGFMWRLKSFLEKLFLKNHLDILKFTFWKFIRTVPQCCLNLQSPSNSCNRRSFSKVNKISKIFATLHLSGASKAAFSYTDWCINLDDLHRWICREARKILRWYHRYHTHYYIA